MIVSVFDLLVETKKNYNFIHDKDTQKVKKNGNILTQNFVKFLQLK